MANMQLNNNNIGSRANSILIGLVAINAGVLVASTAAGAKMIGLPFGLAASATVFSYAISFVFTDLINEIYGREKARLAVTVGFIALITGVLIFYGAIYAPAAEFWGFQSEFEQTLGLAGRILAGAWLAYLVSQNLDVFLFDLLKKKTSGKHLWLRNNATRLFSQFLDTCIFMTIAFYGVFPLWEAIIGQYLIKVLIALMDTPLVYVGRFLILRSLPETERDAVEHEIRQ